MTTSQAPPRTRGSTLLWSVTLGAGTVAAYGAFLGWDQRKDLDPATAALTGPYQPWQVIGLAAAAALLAFEAGRRGRPGLAVLMVPVVLTACFSVDAATEADGDGLWPIGAALVALGSLLGTGAAAGIGAYLGRRHRAPR